MKLMREFRGVSGEYQIDQLHTSYLTGSYGVTPWLEVFARVGVVDLEASDSSQEWVPGPFGPWLVNVNLTNNYDFDKDMIYGAGAKVTLGCVGNVTFGAAASYSWTNIDGDSNRTYYGWFGVQREAYPAKMDAKMQQIQLALGATWNVTENVAIYGGALMHHVRIQDQREFVASFKDDDVIIKNDDGGSMFGGYAGVTIGLVDNLSLTVEGSYTGDSQGGSAMLGWAF
jgi:opacity protein-like surface antigen